MSLLKIVNWVLIAINPGEQVGKLAGVSPEI